MLTAHIACFLLIFVSTVFSGVQAVRTTGVSTFSDVDWVTRNAKYQYCGFCQIAIRLLMGSIAANHTFDDIRKPMIGMCTAILTQKGADGKFMCPGLIDSFVPAGLSIAQQIVADPHSVCQELTFCVPNKITPSYSTTKFPHNSKPSTSVKISMLRPPINKNNTIKIVQINDFHGDHRYVEGSPTVCGTESCCRTEYNGTGSAGPFGDYGCDAPFKTTEVLLDAINELEPRPEFILFTGDFPPHDMAEESWTTQLAADHYGVAFLKQNLPNFTIYPALGNHETFPQSLYYQPGAKYQDFNNLTAIWWQQLFPVPVDQVENIKYSAYYTTLVRPGLRLLTFNTQYGLVLNFYCLLNEKVPAYRKQKEFMEKTLRDARLKGEKVIMMGHVPPGVVTDALATWGDFYTDLVTRYADVIVLQVFGHTHYDQFELVTDPHDRYKPTGVLFVAPAMTTHRYINPSFRVYHLDANTFELLDYDQYHINLTEANAVGNATVELSYSAIQEYGLPDMSPDSYLDLIHRFHSENETFDLYWENFFTKSHQVNDCDVNCRKLMICKARSASQKTLAECTQT